MFSQRTRQVDIQKLEESFCLMATRKLCEEEAKTMSLDEFARTCKLLDVQSACAVYAEHRKQMRGQLVDFLLINGIFDYGAADIGVGKAREKVRKAVNNFCQTHAAENTEHAKKEALKVFDWLCASNMDAVRAYMAESDQQNEEVQSVRKKLREEGQNSNCAYNIDNTHVNELSASQRVVNDSTRFTLLYSRTLDVLEVVLKVQRSQLYNALHYPLKQHFLKCHAAQCNSREAVLKTLQPLNILDNVQVPAGPQQRAFATTIQLQQQNARKEKPKDYSPLSDALKKPEASWTNLQLPQMPNFSIGNDNSQGFEKTFCGQMLFDPSFQESCTHAYQQEENAFQDISECNNDNIRFNLPSM